MATRKSTTMNTGRIPLEFAKAVSAAADAAWKDGSFVKSVTPVTRELLKYWFEEPFTNRPLNFHEGQRQAILNAIYLHEVANAANPSDAWEKVAPAMLAADGASVMAELAKPKYAYPKYCVATAPSPSMERKGLRMCDKRPACFLPRYFRRRGRTPH